VEQRHTDTRWVDCFTWTTKVVGEKGWEALHWTVILLIARPTRRRRWRAGDCPGLHRLQLHRQFLT